MGDVLKGPGEQFLLRVAGDVAELRVDPQEASIGPDVDHAGAGLIEGDAERFFALFELPGSLSHPLFEGFVEASNLRLGLFAPGDVPPDAEHASHDGMIEQVVDDALDPTPRPVLVRIPRAARGCAQKHRA